MNCTICGAAEEHFSGEECVEHLKSKLDERTTQLREIVAWFDVMHSKYVVDGTPVELSEEWPSDWMRRAREAVLSSEDSGLGR